MPILSVSYFLVHSLCLCLIYLFLSLFLSLSSVTVAVAELAQKTYMLIIIIFQFKWFLIVQYLKQRNSEFIVRWVCSQPETHFLCYVFITFSSPNISAYILSPTNASLVILSLDDIRMELSFFLVPFYLPAARDKGYERNLFTLL